MSEYNWVYRGDGVKAYHDYQWICKPLEDQRYTLYVNSGDNEVWTIELFYEAFNPDWLISIEPKDDYSTADEAKERAVGMHEEFKKHIDAILKLRKNYE